MLTGTPPSNAPAWFAAALADRPEELRVEVAGAGIEVLAWGRRGAPGLLLLHGFRAHARWWAHIAPLLSAHRRVVAFSLSGMGGSDWRPRYTFDAYADEAIAAAEAGGLFESESAPVVLGHSMGGYVATLLAARPRPRLGVTILVDVKLRAAASSPPRDLARRLYGTREEAVARFRFTPEQGYEPYIRRMIAEHSVVPTIARSDDGDIEEGWAWRFDPRLASRSHRIHVWDCLRRPTCPLAFIRGLRSRLVSADMEAAVRAQAPPGSAFVGIPEAGHHPAVDQPLALVASIETILAMWDAARERASRQAEPRACAPEQKERGG